MTENDCVQKIRAHDKAHPKNECSKKKSLNDKAECYKEAITPSRAVESSFNLSTIGDVKRHTYISSPASSGGTGWDVNLRLGKLYTDGGFLASIGYSSATLYQKLLPSGDPSKSGTSAKSESAIFSLNFARRDNSSDRFFSESSTSLGFGSYSLPDANKDWGIFTIRRLTSLAATLNAGGLSITPSAGLGFESILALNKDSNQSTLRDDARRMSMFFGVELGFFNPNAGLLKEHEQRGSTLSLFHYIYSDFTAGLSSVIDSVSIDGDAAIAQSTIENTLGKNDTISANALSDKPFLLAAAHLVSGKGAANQRKQFKLMPDSWHNGLLGYHLIRSLALGGTALALDNHDVLAPAAFSSFRNLADLWALDRSGTPDEALNYHLIIGTGTMLLGALGGSSPIGQVISQAGMEGLTATSFQPNPLGTENWIESVSHEYIPLTLYNRSDRDKSGTRPGYRRETLLKSGMYLASTFNTPTVGIGDTGSRIGTMLPGSSGHLDGPLNDVTLPSSVANTLGYEFILGEESRLQLHINAGGGAQLEYSDSAVTPGITGELESKLTYRPTDSWSLGLSGRCSATLFMNGNATECGMGIGINIDQ